ncbi:MAG: hypothetical protein DWH78_06630 [Planctomycetota bacterium]|nr:MAG: hypothetical protein DWH78_06630 [Planctomycetota bacterium]
MAVLGISSDANVWVLSPLLHSACKPARGDSSVRSEGVNNSSGASGWHRFCRSGAKLQKHSAVCQVDPNFRLQIGLHHRRLRLR